LVAEGWESSDHFVDDTAEAPPVDGLIVTLFLDHFWGQVLGSSADRHSLFVLEVECAGEAEVSDLDVTGFVEQDVLGFEAAWREQYSR
jgi:hypothetical protein